MNNEIRVIPAPARWERTTHYGTAYASGAALSLHPWRPETATFTRSATHLYGKVYKPYVRTSIAQAAVRDGVAAANARRATLENRTASRGK